MKILIPFILSIVLVSCKDSTSNDEINSVPLNSINPQGNTMQVHNTTTKLAAFLALSALSFSSIADVPHEFVTGTPATALELNDNFSSLDDRVDLVEAGAVLDCDRGDSTFSEKDHRSLSYVYTPSEPGDAVVIDGVDYVVVKFPFVDHDTAEAYHLTLLANIDKDNDYHVELFTAHTDIYTECQDLLISGYPAIVDTDFTREIMGRYADPSNGNPFSTTSWSYAHEYLTTIKIKINKTLVTFSFRTDSFSEQSDSYDMSTGYIMYDYTTVLLPELMIASRISDSTINQIVSYIKIDKL